MAIVQPGSHLGPYEVLAQVGAGGMGEIYKAQDTRLNRTVAIKVLPVHFSNNPEMKARFEREAHTIAGLNHPHICVLHDIGHQDGTDYLVMEYLEGQTLASRLTKGALPLDEALRVAIEIAGALDKAHRQGVVHRDLKPSNVMLTRAGSKLLDFGLAKVTRPVVATSGLSMMPTTPSAPMTAQGTILGTFQYMAPEQIEGEEADARTDIFAFGCLLYEMLTGRKAFTGKTQASLISAILKDHPQSIADLQPLTPAALDRVVSTCLAKDPDDRWQHAGDVGRELKWIADNPTIPVAAGRQGSAVRERVVMAIACLLTAATVALGWMAYRGPRDAIAVRSMHLKLLLEPSQGISRVDAMSSNDPHPSIVLSPDGTRLVYVADRDGGSQLFVRDLSSTAASPIAGTEGAVGPFFSPDGQWVGFWVNRKLKKVALRGGAPVTLADAPFLRGAHWYANDSIVFVPDLYTGVRRITASGGKPEEITIVDAKNGERSHRWPDVLPGGKALLFAVGTGGSWDDARIVVQSLETGQRRTLIEAGSNPRYVPSGHVVYSRAGTLTVVPFDARVLTITGPPIKVVDDLMTESDGAAQFTFAPTGLFAALAAVREERQAAVVWVDRNGTVTRAPGLPGSFGMLALAPDGHRVLLGQGVLSDLRLRDLSRGTEAVVTSTARVNQFAWLPDGSVVFGSEKAGSWNLMRKSADGMGDEQPLLPAGPARFAMDTSRDGKSMVYQEQGATGNSGLWLMSLADRNTRPLPQTDGSECCPAISPDGKYVASGVTTGAQTQVFLQPLPSGGQRWQASTDGGTEPRWSPDGHELFYRNRNQMMAVSVSATSGAPDIGAPRVLFEGRFVSVGSNSYSVGPDGRFLLLQPLSDPKPLVTLDVITNWFGELGRLTANK